MLSVTITDASGRTLSGQTLEAQTESLLREGIEGVHLYALNRLETVRRFSQLIQPVSGRHDTYPENPEKYSIAENSKIPMTV